MSSQDSLRVAYTRGKGCLDLAEALGGVGGRVGGDLSQACIDQKAELLVAKRLPSNFDLVNVAVPIDFEVEKVRRVVATVGGGPHSILAAETAARVARHLGVEAEMLSAASEGDDLASKHGSLSDIEAAVGGIAGRVVLVDGIDELVADLDEGTLLVLGAPGGSWLNRSRTGPGARLKRTAQAGVIVVRSAPDRVYQHMGEPVYVAPLRHADDTLRMHDENTIAVAESGRLIGLVRRDRLVRAGSDTVATVMEDAQSVRVDQTLTSAWDLEPDFRPDPIPVTDDQENLVGGLSLPVA